MKKLYYFLLLAMLCGCSNDDSPIEPPGPPRPAMNVQDSLAIVAYYHSMKCAEWKEPYCWDLTDIHTWGSIEIALDAEKNEYRVTGIWVGDPVYLPYGYQIPPELGNLPYLESVVIFGDERASGGIPKELFNCPLKPLYILGKGFTGTIPKEIGNVGNTLEWLKISGTSIGGTIPDEIAELQHLQGPLLLYNNKFSGKVPLCLRKMSVVSSLESNYFTEMDWRYFTEDIGYVPDLYKNCLSGEIPQEVLETERWKDFGSKLTGQKEGYGYDEEYFY